ncbi:redoxin domain-containing protein [Zopfochytrium polystomum]|nr:redoxin domain-containing protein [Zopfochytrium polystomum]
MSAVEVPIVKVGDSIPEGITLWTSSNSHDKDACALPQKTSTTELFKGKRAVLVGIPIPFSPTCSIQQLPGFVAKAAELKAKGVEAVAVVNCYDVFVQDAWGKAQGAAAANIVMLSDSNGDLLGPLGLTQDLSKGPLPLGARVSKRFAIVIDDLKVTYVGIDPKGFEASSVESVLAHL